MGFANLHITTPLELRLMAEYRVVFISK